MRRYHHKFYLHENRYFLPAWFKLRSIGRDEAQRKATYKIKMKDEINVCVSEGTLLMDDGGFFKTPLFVYVGL